MFVFSEHVNMQNVPCYMRSLVNNSMDKQMLVNTTDGHAYIFDLLKLQKFLLSFVCSLSGSVRLASLLGFDMCMRCEEFNPFLLVQT